LPLFVLLCLAIKLDSPGPVLYRQLRLRPDGGWVSVLNFRRLWSWLHTPT